MDKVRYVPTSPGKVSLNCMSLREGWDNYDAKNGLMAGICKYGN